MVSFSHLAAPVSSGAKSPSQAGSRAAEPLPNLKALWAAVRQSHVYSIRVPLLGFQGDEA